MERRPRLIILEGAQGVGKGTVSSLLREQMPYTNLLRLSGIKDKGSSAKYCIYRMHNSILDLILNTSSLGINYILDRSFLSEDVYCELGYKDYSFKANTDKLSHKLNHIGERYDVQFILLTAKESDFKSRLLRQKPQYAGVEFRVSNSLNQQNKYLERIKYLKGNCPNIDFGVVSTSKVDLMDVMRDIIQAKEGI